MISNRNQVKCRPIADDDCDGAVDCLVRGFPSRPRSYWTTALSRLSRLPILANIPRYGHLLESEGKVVGVLLQIFSRRGKGEGAPIFCNLSSWCVDPDFRAYAGWLSATACANKSVTYFNISPAPHTRPGIEAQGFRRYCEGQFLCVPSLSPARRRPLRVAAFVADSAEAALLTNEERQILSAHAEYGCLSLVVAADGQAFPFAFVARKIARRIVPCEQLVYCREIVDVATFAGPIGRYLLKRGALFCLMDANGPLTGLAGRYFPGRGPKYFKGPSKPTLGDLSFTEMTVFGP